MQSNKLVIQVPPNFMWDAVDIDKVRKTRWEVKPGSDKVVRHISCVPFFGTRELWKVIEEGDFLVFIESPLDELYQFAWNLHVMKEKQYKEWAKHE
nr:MAG TPA: hypothetical protein [Caudoviricetes sp.]